MMQTAISQLETDLITQAGRQFGRRLGSVEIGTILLHMIGEHARAGQWTRTLPLLIRLALKANPYAPNVEAMLADHTTVTGAWASRTMPALLETIAACRALKLPVPLVVSCEKYLPKARYAQQAMRERYFGIEPIIIRGDGAAAEESFAAPVLCLPVHDSCEALPAKMFETLVLLDALGADHGILKLDDDLRPVPVAPLKLDNLQAIFGAAAYMGTALSSVHHDRSWHFGKCDSDMPAIYGKPFRAPWARGAVYYLSGRALRTVARQFLLFPGCIDGEFYEDKAIGDVLHEAGISVSHYPLEDCLGISTAAPERALVAAE